MGIEFGRCCAARAMWAVPRYSWLPLPQGQPFLAQLLIRAWFRVIAWVPSEPIALMHSFFSMSWAPRSTQLVTHILIKSKGKCAVCLDGGVVAH